MQGIVLALAVTDKMVRSGPRLGNITQKTKLLYQSALNVAALIGMDMIGDPQLVKSFRDKDLGYSCGMVPGRNGKRVLAKHISPYYNIYDASTPGRLYQSEVQGQDWAGKLGSAPKNFEPQA